jgi:putative two-component system response regulator
LSTIRPYRDAWPIEKVLTYLEERAGTEFDSDLIAVFIRTMRHGRAEVRVLNDDRCSPEDAPAPHSMPNAQEPPKPVPAG